MITRKPLWLLVALGAVKCGVTNFQISFMILVVNCKDINQAVRHPGAQRDLQHHKGLAFQSDDDFSFNGERRKSKWRRMSLQWLFVALGAVKCGVTNFQISFMILVVNCKDINQAVSFRPTARN